MAWASKGPTFAEILKQRQQREREEKEAAVKEAKLREEEAKKARAEAEKAKAEEAKLRQERSLGTRPRFGPGHPLTPAQPAPLSHETKPQNPPEIKNITPDAVVKDSPSSNEVKSEPSSASKQPVSDAKVPSVTPVKPSKSSPGPSVPNGKDDPSGRSSVQKDGHLPSSSSSATSLTHPDSQSSSKTEDKTDDSVKDNKKPNGVIKTAAPVDGEKPEKSSSSSKTDAKVPSQNGSKPMQKPIAQNGLKQDTARRKNEGGGDAGYYHRDQRYYNGYNHRQNGYGYDRSSSNGHGYSSQQYRTSSGYQNYNAHPNHQQPQTMSSWDYQNTQQVDGNGYSYQQQQSHNAPYPYYDNSAVQYYQPVTEITTRNGPLFVNPMFSSVYPYYDASQAASYSSGDASSGQGGYQGVYGSNGYALAPGLNQPAAAAAVPITKSFYFDADFTGLIFGKQGSHIKDLSYRFHCEMWVDDEEETQKPGFSVLYIHGMNDNIDAAAHQVHRRLDSNGGTLLPVVGIHSENVLYPQVLKLGLPLGSAIQAFVSHVDDETVFIQQPSHPTYTKLYGLEAQLAKYCSDVQVPLINVHHSPVDKGCYVVAPVNDTDQWLRAVVVSPPDEDGMILLRSLDHGFPFSVPATGLKLLQPDFCTTPMQATECKLITGKYDNKKTVAEQINYNVPTSVNKQWVKIRAVGKEDESDIPVIEMWINPCG